MGETHILDSSGKLAILVPILRPLTRLCLKRSFYIQDVIEALKIAFIESAQRELNRQSQKTNVSRLSVITGIRRREIKRLFLDQELKSDDIGLVTKIIGLWTTGRQFTTLTGKPKTLDPDFEFPKLVRTVSNDLHPGTVLFELERLSLVKHNRFGLKLRRPGLVSRSEDAIGYRLLAEDIKDLIEAIEENVESKSAIRPNPHAKTYFDNIDQASIPKIRTWLRRENKRIHKRLRDYLSQFDLDINNRRGAVGGVRVAFGTFGRIQTSKERK